MLCFLVSVAILFWSSRYPTRVVPGPQGFQDGYKRVPRAIFDIENERYLVHPGNTLSIEAGKVCSSSLHLRSGPMIWRSVRVCAA